MNSSEKPQVTHWKKKKHKKRRKTKNESGEDSLPPYSGLREGSCFWVFPRIGIAHL
jgi:hypothetical protein